MARQIITALFDDLTTAQAALSDLVNAGVKRDDISLVAADATGDYTRRINSGDIADEDVKGGEGAGFGAVVGALVGLGAMAIPGIGPIIAAGPIAAALIGAGVGAAAGAVTGGVTASLVDMGIDTETATYYEEGLRRGGTLVIANIDDAQVDKVISTLNSHHPTDLDTKVSEWQRSGWAGYSGSDTVDTAASARASTPTTSSTPQNKDDVRAQVIQEDLKVGKREVNTGGVRVHTYVTETPVEEDITLRQEHVNVERRPVDRPASSADFNQRDQSFVVTERSEEPVVSKEARVVEEVVVRKDVDTRNEKVTDTVRRQDVDVERDANIGTRSTNMSSDFANYDSDFRSHYKQTYNSADYDYDYYIPAYEYGYRLATDDRYRDYDWNTIETAARQNWDNNNPGTWEEVKAAVSHAWKQVKASFR